ncbi:hypothetical protein [Brochothrix thermosphacta]|nr:hypothetical protein [Brochothrix thermosphacta]
MTSYGWTVTEVDSQPYERLLTLVLEKETKKAKKQKAIPAHEFLDRLG